jgi:hypothetical protein
LFVAFDKKRLITPNIRSVTIDGGKHPACQHHSKRSFAIRLNGEPPGRRTETLGLAGENSPLCSAILGYHGTKWASMGEAPLANPKQDLFITC